MWMNGSSRARSTPAKARRTGKPSPSNPDGAVVTDVTGRSAAAVGSGSVTRGRTRMSSTVTAGMTTPQSCALAGQAFRRGGKTHPSRVSPAPTIVDRATFPETCPGTPWAGFASGRGWLAYRRPWLDSPAVTAGFASGHGWIPPDGGSAAVLWQPPVDGRTALALQELVGPAEGA